MNWFRRLVRWFKWKFLWKPAAVVTSEIHHPALWRSIRDFDVFVRAQLACEKLTEFYSRRPRPWRPRSQQKRS